MTTSVLFDKYHRLTPIKDVPEGANFETMRDKLAAIGGRALTRVLRDMRAGQVCDLLSQHKVKEVLTPRLGTFYFSIRICSGRSAPTIRASHHRRNFACTLE
jgi:hypothetical protein